jgi:two-component system KDP operon response regulator KdpE
VTRVLVVDDEPQILRTLATNLRARGYDVDLAATGEDALRLAAERHPDVVILDIGLPGIDGIEVVRGLRGWSQVPIIMLSVREGEGDKVEALDAGADDYIALPLQHESLLARIRVALRRSGVTPEVSAVGVGPFHIDFDDRRVRIRGQAVRLTPKEFDLFTFMAKHPNRVLPHKMLLGAVWGPASEEQSEYLRVFVGQLRKKLEPDPARPRHLVTEPWVGYRFNPEGAEQA